MGSNSLITIIIAVYNGEKTLARCIDSVINQTYPNKELIIMDGGSTDGTVGILKRYDARINYWESKPDRGIYHAWNKALDHAEGEWICFIGCDDFFIDSSILKRALPAFHQATKERSYFVYGRVAIFSNVSNKIISYGNKPWPRMRKQLAKGKCLMHSGSFHHRLLFEKFGKFNEGFKIAGDFDFVLRVLKNHNAFYIPEPMICMGHGGLSMNLATKECQLIEAISVFRKNRAGLIPSALIVMILKVKAYIFLQKLLGKKISSRLGYYYSILRGKAPIEFRY